MTLIRTVLDFETAYGKHPVTGENITLSKMTTEEYIRHPLFKVHGLGVQIEAETPFYLYKPDDLMHFLRTHPWGRAFTICHHSQFDGAILAWRAGVKPIFWGDTLSMGRALFPYASVSLSNLSKLLAVGEKGTELVHSYGKWVLSDAEQEVLGSYCINDVILTGAVFDALKRHFPVSEMRLIDLTVRLFTEPCLNVDRGILLTEYIRERRAKRALIRQCITDKSTLASNPKFAQLLLSLGVDPPKKISPSKVKDGRVDPAAIGEAPRGMLPEFKVRKGMSLEERVQLKQRKTHYPWAYAFSKGDELFSTLQKHPDPKVRAIIDARMGVKSTIRETRSKRFYKIGGRGTFSVYLKYYGAHTNRWSGGDRQNAQNLNRSDPKDPASGVLRRSWLAPPGHVVVVRDLGQIECRMLACWAGQEDLLDLFRQGGDPYNRQASLVFGYEVNRKLPQFKLEGMAGKASVLGCGYQMGWSKFQEALRIGFLGMPSLVFSRADAEKLGADADVFCYQRSYKQGFATLRDEALAMKPLNMSDESHLWHCAAVKRVVDKYRASNAAIVQLWASAGQALGAIIAGEEVVVGRPGLIHTCKEGLELPNGMKIRYYKLRRTSTGEYRYLSNARKKEWSYIYGGKVVENCTQALARIVLSDQMLAIQQRLRSYPLRPGEWAQIVSTTHDEIIVVVPRRFAAACLLMMEQEMATAPPWCAGLPLVSSGGYAANYGDCEK